jgi:hypothetical protein
MTIDFTEANNAIYKCNNVPYKAWIDLGFECEVEMPVSSPTWCLDQVTGLDPGYYPADWVYGSGARVPHAHSIVLDYVSEPTESTSSSIGPYKDTFEVTTDCVGEFKACFRPRRCFDSN